MDSETSMDLEEKVSKEQGKKAIIQVTNDEHKPKRKRKRHHFNAIRAQMEFYFSNANLSKDRFLMQTIEKDPFVPLELFLTFNKMKALTSSVDEIAKALSNSDLLELDDTQQKVRRNTPIPKERNVDEKTLYIEGLPPNADHEWVRQVFELFGSVAYVSLPRYSKSRKIKEFGFVEFEKESSIVKAIKAFQEFNGVLSMEKTNPDELKSIKAYIKEQNNEEDTTEPMTSDASLAKKRAKEPTDEDEDIGEPKPKKNRLIGTETSNLEETGSSSETDTSFDADAEGSKENNDDANADTSPSKKKQRRRKKRRKSKSGEKAKQVDNTEIEATFYDLKILPKRDWKRLRNKYLNLQREKMCELKRKWRKEREEQQQSGENTCQDAELSMPTPAKKMKPNEGKLHKMNMNFYGAGDDDSQSRINAKELKQNPAQERAPLFTFEPGLIVEVGFMEPCVTVKDFKAEMRQYSNVKYVDVKEGAIYAHIRVETPEAAEEFARRVHCAEYRCNVLSGEAEQDYWKKIELDREMKLNKQVKVPQKRGRQKIKKLVSKHIRFGDENEE